MCTTVKHLMLCALLVAGTTVVFCRGMNYLHQHKPEAVVHRDLKPR
jgi:serine/threonine protein kinase